MLRSAGFPLWVCECIYFLVQAVLVFTGEQKLPMGTQVLREGSCSPRSAISKLLSKSRWVLWNPHHHHLSSILCMLLHGLAGAITTSPDSGYSLTLLQDQRGKLFFLLSLCIHITFVRISGVWLHRDRSILRCVLWVSSNSLS